MSINFSQFPLPSLPINQNDFVVGYQNPGTNGVPTLAQYTWLQAAGIIGSLLPPPTPASGSLLNVQVFTSSGTYTATPGTNSVIVGVQAPGGGGGGITSTTSGVVAIAQGGAGGAYALVRITSGFNGSSVTLGAPGAGGAAGPNAGGSGGGASFGTFVICPTAAPGQGGIGVATPFVQRGAFYTTLPTVAGAQLIFSTPGSASTAGIGATPTNISPSLGGTSFLGVGSSYTSVGVNGQGGDGAANIQSTLAAAGTAGAPGLVIVYEYS
jgi:hypothetical protein